MVGMGSGSLVYSIDPKIVTLQDYGHGNFLKEIARLREESYVYDKKNANWFNHLPSTYNSDKYLDWFFLYDNTRPVAFATIQRYYDGCYRVCTRTYIYREYRRFVHPKNDQVFSPSQHLCLAQLDYLKTWDTVFVSMQGLNRRNSIHRFKEKIERRTGLPWHVPEGMYQTSSPAYDPDAYQNIVYNGLVPHLNKMDIETYRIFHG